MGNIPFSPMGWALMRNRYYRPQITVIASRISTGRTSFTQTGGALAPNGRIYAASTNNVNPMIVNTNDSTISTNTFGLSWTGTTMYYGALATPDGQVYFTPAHATNVSILNTNTNTGSRPSYGLNLSGNWKSVCGRFIDGTIMIPMGNTPGALEINHAAGSGKFTDIGSSGALHLSSSMPGKAFIANSNNIRIYDYRSWDMELISFDVPLNGSVGGVVDAGNGKIYLIPRYATEVGIYDVKSKTLSRTNFGISFESTSVSKYRGAAMAPDGRIYCPPDEATTALVIDTVTETAYRSGFSAGFGTAANRGYLSAFYANGAIWGLPYQGTHVLKLQLEGLENYNLNDYLISQYVGCGGWG